MSEKVNSQKSFAEMAGYVKESQLAVLNYVDEKKYVPSTDETEYHEECKMMIHMLFGSLKMVTCCYVLLDKVDLINRHQDLDILSLINQLHSGIQQRIERKT